MKCRSINNVIERSIPLKRLKNYIKYFKRELEIVKPKTVVALSEKTYAILKGMLATLSVRNVQLLKIWSYSYAYRCRKREEFEELFKRLRNTV
ncbi:hypothetical protein J7K06_05620 [Candidatus Bathyarchaeota archaeon]|nr:hypothetical protein [Candidatus Bathyarchaeota archaeon]